MVSILVPISYLAILFGSLAVFSRYYRSKQSKKEVTPPWFPRHKSRDIYISLLSLPSPPPRPILIAALLRRAMDDVRLIWSVRDAKTSLTTLLQKGQIGDELWERFLNAEKELEAEIVEVVGEANTFQAGYGQQIFAIASEMVSHERWKDMYEGIGKKREEEAARLASPLPSLALSPSSYLTPTSLTLAPSNPLSTSSLESAPLSLTSSTASTTPAPASLSPLLSSTVTSAPPSRESTPAPTSTTQSESKVTPVVSPAESVDGDEEDEEPASSGTKSPPLTPGGSKRKTPIKKKKVKGGK